MLRGGFKNLSNFHPVETTPKLVRIFVSIFNVDMYLSTVAATSSAYSHLMLGAVKDFLLIGVRGTGIGDCISFGHFRHLLVHQLKLFLFLAQVSGQCLDDVHFVVSFQILACPTMRARACLSIGLLVEIPDAFRAKYLGAFWGTFAVVMLLQNKWGNERLPWLLL